TSPTLQITEPGDYSVNVIAANGCPLKATTTITALPAPVVTVTATPEIIDEGQTVQLEATGLTSYAWTPSSTLSDATIYNPVGIPLTTTTFVVKGRDFNNCRGEASVEVRVRGEAIVRKLGPKNFFSPNGDASNPYSRVDKIDEYPQCEVTVYDDKGVKVYS